MTSKISVTMVGIFIAVGGTLLVNFGFSQICSTEIINKILMLVPVLSGGGIAYVGRLRQGDVDMLGFKR